MRKGQRDREIERRKDGGTEGQREMATGRKFGALSPHLSNLLSLCLSGLVSTWFAFPIASAQTGEIMGRVVTEDGSGAPTSTRNTAGEVKIAAGEEVSGIDIRHRRYRSRVI